MFLLSALDPADAVAGAAPDRRVHRGRGGGAAPDPGRERAACRPGPDGFGLLAAEFGLRQYDAVHGWALWAIEQLAPAEQSTG